MSDITAAFYKSVQRTDDVYSFLFKPAENFGFIPGQFLQVIFDEENRNNKELNKYISLSCAPGKEFIEITKKMSGSKFSQRLRSLKQDDKVLINGPMGKCTFKKDAGKIGFIVGGIGITPVISILEHVSNTKIECDIHLIYGNWNEKQIAFKSDMDLWEQGAVNKLKVTHVIAEPDPEDGVFIKGFITDEIVKKYMPDYKERMMCIFGPPKMVAAMKEICINIGCSKDKVESESFIGY